MSGSNDRTFPNAQTPTPAPFPSAWEHAMRRGHSRRRQSVPVGYGQGETWFAHEIPFYDLPMSGPLSRATDPDRLAEEMNSGAHDCALARAHEAVALATEGHHGLKLALDRIKSAFAAEFVSREQSGDGRALAPSEVAEEWRRMVDGEASKVQGDLDNDMLQLSSVGGYAADDLDALDFDVFAAWLNTNSRHRRPPTMTTTTGAKVELPELVDATEYPNNDTGRAHMFLDTLGTSAVALDDVDNEWMIRLGNQWHHMTADQIHAALWGSTVTAALTDAAVRLKATAQTDAAQKIADAMHRAAQKSGDVAVMVRGVRHAHKACAHRRSLMDFDADLALGADNGVIDVAAYQRTGDPADLLRPAAPDDLVTESVGYAFDPYAHSARVDRFLDLFIPDRELRRDVFRVLGSMIVTGNPLRHFVTVIGETSTGKTTLTRYLNASLGAYCAPGSTAMFGGSAGPNPELLDSVRRRVLTMSETNSRVIFHGDTLKMLTGNDTIAARKLYSNKVVKATPRFTPILVTNQMPSITEADDAVFTRLIVIPFTHQHRDKVDEAEFTPADRSHFLRLVIDGYLDGLDNKWIEASDLCAQIADATETARGALDPFRAWATDHFVEDTSATLVDRINTTSAWKVWSASALADEVPDDLRRLTQRQFSARMRAFYGEDRSPRKVEERQADGTIAQKSRRFYAVPIVARDDID
ncbi:hypothetical protein [Gordonia sputi]|uniref:hypothetical protein n=1 Tax=Gordonia sputi TaxID=36823 RepID=UPI00368E4A62